jgi:hypothetical protein
MLAQGMVRSRSEATQLVRQGAVRVEHGRDFSFVADCDDLDLPGKTVVRVGKHMFRLVARKESAGWDQLRGRIEIPVTAPEGEDGCIHISLSEVAADPAEIEPGARAWDPLRGEVVILSPSPA